MCLRTGGSILPHVCRDALPRKGEVCPAFRSSTCHGNEETDTNFDQVNAVDGRDDVKRASSVTDPSCTQKGQAPCRPRAPLYSDLPLMTPMTRQPLSKRGTAASRPTVHSFPRRRSRKRKAPGMARSSPNAPTAIAPRTSHGHINPTRARNAHRRPVTGPHLHRLRPERTAGGNHPRRRPLRPDSGRGYAAADNDDNNGHIAYGSEIRRSMTPGPERPPTDAQQPDDGREPEPTRPLPKFHPELKR